MINAKLAPATLQPVDRFGSTIALKDGRMLVSAAEAGGGQTPSTSQMP